VQGSIIIRLPEHRCISSLQNTERIAGVTVMSELKTRGQVEELFRHFLDKQSNNKTRELERWADQPLVVYLGMDDAIVDFVVRDTLIETLEKGRTVSSATLFQLLTRVTPLTITRSAAADIHRAYLSAESVG
jgi:hypothetical protein